MELFLEGGVLVIALLFYMKNNLEFMSLHLFYYAYFISLPLAALMFSKERRNIIY